MKLNRLRYSNQVMTDFVDEFEEIFNRLDGMGSSFPENMQVAMFLSSFGEKNQTLNGPIVAALQTTASDLSWEIVTARMLQEYDEMQCNPDAGSTRNDQKRGHALASTAPPRKVFHRDRKKHFRGTCYRCGEIGHYIRDRTSSKGREKETFTGKYFSAAAKTISRKWKPGAALFAGNYLCEGSECSSNGLRILKLN